MIVAPVRSVADLQIKNILETTMEFSWTALPCEEMTGQFVTYELRLTEQDTGR